MGKTKQEIILETINILDEIIDQANYEKKIEISKNKNKLINNGVDLNKILEYPLISLLEKIKGRLYFIGSVGKSNSNVNFFDDELREFKKALLKFRE